MRVPTYKLKLVRAGWIPYSRIDMKHPQLAAFLFHRLIGQAAVEHSAAIFLDPVGHIIGASIIAIGDLGSVPMVAREVLKGAILANGASVIVSHNHPAPSSSEPSTQDIRVTRRLIRAGEIVGIHVLDHIIVTPGQDFTSMREAEPALWCPPITDVSREPNAPGETRSTGDNL
jgi:DNA repair protein RadC